MEKKLSVVVPFRDREEHLKVFVPWMIKALNKEEIPFHIFIINQGDSKGFNRAKLLNVGFKESESFDYFSFHDVDMLPTDSDYSFPDGPTHLATEAEQFGYRLPYDGYFGGVTLFDKESFLKINGYCNEYWGWGAEDDDVLLRCRIMQVSTFRKSCRYRSLQHERKIEQMPYNMNLYRLADFQRNPTEENVLADGISNLKYEKINSEILNEHCTKITVIL
jgi:beta-1,4-galactosyltransferase 2